MSAPHRRKASSSSYDSMMPCAAPSTDVKMPKHDDKNSKWWLFGHTTVTKFGVCGWAEGCFSCKERWRECHVNEEKTVFTTRDELNDALQCVVASGGWTVLKANRCAVTLKVNALTLLRSSTNVVPRLSQPPANERAHGGNVDSSSHDQVL